MRKFISILLAVLLTTTFFGCSDRRNKAPKENVTADEKMVYSADVYDELRDRYLKYLSDGTNDDGLEGTSGLEEVVRSEDQNAVNVVGYAVRDINGDGIPEFLVGLTDEYCRGNVKNQLYVLYTCKDGEPVFVFEGWSRNVHSLTEDNKIFVSGSSSASESEFGIYELPTGADWLKPKDYYFSTVVDGEGRFFHNQSGDFNIESSKRLLIKSEAFFELRNDMAKKTVNLELNPFSALMGADTSERISHQANVTVSFADEQLLNSSKYDYFVVNDTQGVPEIAFNTDVPVTNFQVTRLKYDYSNNGQQHIFEDSVYEYGSLNPGRPLVLKMIIPEGVPDYGISYVDTDGVKKSFNVVQSGETGELFLYEITVE